MNARKVILYGAGQLGIMLLARFFFQWLIKYADLGAESESGALFVGATVGLVFLGFRIFDGVTDPLAGALGDWWVAKGRQRRKLLWSSFWLPPIGLILVFAPHHDMSQLLRWSILCSGMFIFFVGYTLYAIPYWSLVDDYSEGSEETRSKLSNALGVGVLLATALTFVISPLKIENWGLGYLGTAVIYALVGTIFMVLPYFAAPKRVKNAPNTKPPSLSTSLLSSLSDARFVGVIVLFAGSQMSFTVMTASAPFIAEKLLGGTVGDVALLLGPLLLTAFPAFIFVPKVVKRFGWERSSLAASVALGLAYVGAGFLGQPLIGSAMTTAMICFSLAGPGAAFLLGLEGEAIARCAESSQFKSTSMYFSVYNFIVKALNGIALFIAAQLAGKNTVWGVRQMPITAGLLCISGVVLYILLASLRKKKVS